MRHSMQWLLLALATTLPALAMAQEGEDKPANPFDMQGGYGEMTGYGGGGYGGEAAGYGGMGGGYGGAMDYAVDPFRAGLGRLLDRLPKAKTGAEKKQLLKYAHEALTERYQQQLEAREAEISDLERRLEALREEQQRRKDAAERIVDLQMKSLELAAEGLLERDQVINIAPPESRPQRQMRDRGRRGSPYGEAGPYGGGGEAYGGASSYGGGEAYGGGESVTPPAQKPSEEEADSAEEEEE